MRTAVRNTWFHYHFKKKIIFKSSPPVGFRITFKILILVLNAVTFLGYFVQFDVDDVELVFHIWSCCRRISWRAWNRWEVDAERGWDGNWPVEKKTQIPNQNEEEGKPPTCQLRAFNHCAYIYRENGNPLARLNPHRLTLPSVMVFYFCLFESASALMMENMDRLYHQGLRKLFFSFHLQRTIRTIRALVERTIITLHMSLQATS